MIEKKIYYVWIGNAKKPDIFYKCLKSWQEKLPDFEIIEINEKNFDIEGHLKKNRFFRECYERKLWAYMSDYIRVHYMYENSGIYVDTDMEIIKNISPLIENEKMKFFIDTANVDDIRLANDLGVICGVTTNPSLIAKEGRDFKEVIKEITEIVDGPISGEVKATTTNWEDMVTEAREIAKIHPNMVVKIPMTEDGLRAVKILKQEGIKTNVTLIFSANQALLAARAGATYVSPFLGRLDDISHNGLLLIEEIVEIFANNDLDTEIIAASVRNPIHVAECAKMGCDIATVPYSVIKQMIKHPLTDIGIEKFKQDYYKVFGE